MELYERLLHLVEIVADNSQAKFAKSVGILQQTFNNYMDSEGQRKIRFELLATILRVYPQINRDWLLFGEGEMLKQNGEKPATPDEKDRLITELLLENRELRKRLGE